MQFPSKGRYRAILLAATAAATFLAVPNAYALENVAREAKHFFECLGLMLSDPDEHAVQCLPNRVVTSGPLMGGGGGGGLKVMPVVTPPPPPPPPPDECTSCGACYST